MAEVPQTATATAPTHESEGSRDPRIRRTREMLQQALDKLLKEKEFDKISVQDITDAAGVNRATFYAHYPDKFALLECLVGTRFHELLATRGVTFDGTCTGALRGMVLGVCDFLAENASIQCHRQLQMEPHMEAAVVAVVRKMLLDGLRQHPVEGCVPMELRASTVAWAIYGAAKEWSRTPDRSRSEVVSETIVHMLAPLLHAAAQ